ncbi:MAG: PspC domain-containing protein [Chitinophagaceae bacterium]|nr:PspC domain-containing protein [Chitinophagaceae bacterium]
MKKVININFQGRVVPIEETAYELLKQYIESLRKYFVNEEGRDEIINDIESRIAELFSERLKKGVTCITDEDVNAVIAGMGRPEDFEAQEAEPVISTSQQKTYSQQESQSSYTYTTSTPGRGRLYRNADDKILGGVCSGLANYLGIDPVIMRIVFVLLIAPLFWVYILLWIIVPSKSVQSNITKRLYRSTDDKVIGGVCGGLAVYFNISPWIPRLIFALPLIIGLISGPFNFWWNDMDFWWGPKIITGSLGSTLFITYIILWISVPIATTAAEKLEMRGEKVDLNSIRNTVKEDMQSFKSKAQNWGSEVKQTAQQWGEKAKDFGQSAGSTAKTYAEEAGPAFRQTRSGCGHIIGVLFKAFFLFIAGVIALSLFGVFIGLLFGGFAVFPLKNFVLEGFWQNTLAWSTLFLFFGVPIVALITWLIRRIMGVRSKNHYLGYVFGSLWVIGLVSAIILGGLFARNFKTKSGIEEQMSTLVQPVLGKLYLDVASSPIRYYGGDWFGFEGNDDWPVYGINQDTLMLNNVRVNVVKSKDSLFHIFKVSFSRGNNPDVARTLAERIRFNIDQKDSVVILPKGFPISRNDKFRNQQVLVVIEVPVGKRVQIDRSIDNFEWFNIDFNRRRGWNFDWDENWDHTFHWESNKEYIMTPDGLERVDRLDQRELKNGRFKLKLKDGEVNMEVEGEFNNDSQYRYQENRNDRKIKDSVSIKSQNPGADNGNENEPADSGIKRVSAEISAPLTIFYGLFQ